MPLVDESERQFRTKDANALRLLIIDQRFSHDHDQWKSVETIVSDL